MKTHQNGAAATDAATQERHVTPRVHHWIASDRVLELEPDPHSRDAAEIGREGY